MNTNRLIIIRSVINFSNKRTDGSLICCCVIITFRPLYIISSIELDEFGCEAKMEQHV